MNVEVVYAIQGESWAVVLDLPEGTTLREAVLQARMHVAFANLPEKLVLAGYAIWGKQVSEDTILRDGDRVEMLRPLIMDPMERRRAKAAQVCD